MKPKPMSPAKRFILETQIADCKKEIEKIPSQLMRDGKRSRLESAAARLGLKVPR